MTDIEITVSDPDALFDRLPGGRELYGELAEVFLFAYERPQEWAIIEFMTSWGQR